jgi:hypothetical protein
MYSRIRDPELFYPPDPGSVIRIRDGAMVGSGSGINHPGSATQHGTLCNILADSSIVVVFNKLRWGNQCCGSGMYGIIPDPDPTIFSSRIWIQPFFHSGSRILHEKWNTNFFLVSFAFRSKGLVVVIVKKIRDPRSGIRKKFIPDSDPDPGGVKKHRIPDPQHWGNSTLVCHLLFHDTICH